MRTIDSQTFTYYRRAPARMSCSTPDDLLRTYGCLRALLSSVRRRPARADKKALLDLTECHEIDAVAILLSVYLDRILHDIGWELWYLGKPGSAVWSKLGRHLQSARESKRHRPVVQKGAVGELLTREVSDQELMVVAVEQWVSDVRDASGASEEHAARWEVCVGEVMANAFQHGCARGTPAHSNLVTGEMDGRKHIQLAGLDFGAGVPAIVRAAVTDPEMTHGELILEALRDGVTSRTSRSNQGRGLAYLAQAACEGGGTLQVLSLNGLASASGTRKRFRNLAPGPDGTPALQGTLVVLRLATGAAS
jgi:anti-sigma regulatory factor (Ser/Thr protein kinase)